MLFVAHPNWVDVCIKFIATGLAFLNAVAIEY